MRYWGVIPAAGVGKRMGSDIPKQYLPLNGRTVIEETVDRLLNHPMLDGLFIALGKDDGWWNGTEYADHPDVVRVEGGNERCFSVLNALSVLRERAAVDDWVLVHDAARPCIRRQDISKLVEILREHPVGGLLGMPVRDTMKRTDEVSIVVETVDRNNLWHAYTPQMFRLEALYQALSGALESEVLVTDEASAMEWAGHTPLMVEGHSDNIKITHPQDLQLAEFYLQQQLY